MKIGLTGGILQSIVCSGPLLFWLNILTSSEQQRRWSDCAFVVRIWHKQVLSWHSSYINSTDLFLFYPWCTPRTVPRSTLNGHCLFRISRILARLYKYTGSAPYNLFFSRFYRVATGQGKVGEILFFFKVREKLGNFANWSGKFLLSRTGKSGNFIIWAKNIWVVAGILSIFKCLKMLIFFSLDNIKSL